MTQPMEKMIPSKWTDIHGPRKRDLQTDSRKCYDKFIERHPQYKGRVSFQEYRKSIHSINTYYRNFLLNTGSMMHIPNGLGNMIIQRNKRKTHIDPETGKLVVKAPIDWIKSKAEGKYIYILNAETGGYTFRYRWFNKDCRIPHSNIWEMIMTKESKNALRDKIIDPEGNYQSLYKDFSAKPAYKKKKDVSKT